MSIWDKILFRKQKEPEEEEGPLVRASEIHFRAVQEFLSQGHVNEGIRLVQEAVELDPENMIYRNTLASAYHMMGLHDKAFDLWDMILSTAPEMEDVKENYALAIVNRAVTEMDDSEETFRKAVEIDSCCGSAYRELGMLFLRRRQWADAIECLEKALELSKDIGRYPAQEVRAEIQDQLAICYSNTNRYGEAIGYWEQALPGKAWDSEDRESIENEIFAAQTILNKTQTGKESPSEEEPKEAALEPPEEQTPTPEAENAEASSEEPETPADEPDAPIEKFDAPSEKPEEQA